MATEPVITGAPTRAPIIPATSRRTVLSSFALPAIAMLSSATAANLGATPIPVAETDGAAQDDWRALVLAYRQHKAEWESLDAILDKRKLAFKSRRPAAPAKPQLTQEVHQDMTLAEIKAIPHDREWSVYEAEMAEWETRCQPLRQEIVGDTEAATDAAWDRYSAALKAIEAYPSPTLPLLVEKVDLIAAEYDCDDDHVDRVFADIRRLAAVQS